MISSVCPRHSQNVREFQNEQTKREKNTYSQTSRLVKNTEIIIMRCTAFLGGNYGALLNKWETDLKKALLRPARKQKPEDEKARLKRATDGILDAKPHCISRVSARILGSGLSSCDTTTINDQMLAKHPHPKSDDTWTPHERPADDSDEIVLTILPELMDRLDPYVGVGPRGIHAHYHHMLEPCPHEWPRH
jgi:hypothetical protein